MANISIGAVTLRHNPIRMTLVRPEKRSASSETYSSVAYFSWGTSIVGKEIDIEWSYMESDEFDDLDDLFKTDAPVVFDPQDGSGKTYNVEITRLNGEYFRTLDFSAGHFRRNVKMTVLILSEAS